MRILLIFCMLSLAYFAEGQIVETKDGVSIGLRSEFINSCLKGAGKEIIVFEGMKVSMYDYCACTCDRLIPTLNSWDLEIALRDGTMEDLFLEKDNLAIIMNCLSQTMESDALTGSEIVAGDVLSEDIQKKAFITNCVKEIMDDPENSLMWSSENAVDYCECTMARILAGEYTFGDLEELDNENSIVYNELVIPCITSFLKEKSDSRTVNTYIKSDIEGDRHFTSIPLLDYLGSGYKIKVSIGGSSRYYLLDSGASDLIIDRDTERELLLDGTLKKESYLNKKYYSLANNQTVKAQLARVDEVKLGDFTVKNVVLAIIDNGSLLCGKSLLDKFSRWEVDKTNKVLILYR